MNGKHCWSLGGVSDTVMGINTRKTSLKVHYTVNDPRLSPLCRALKNGNSFLSEQSKTVGAAQTENRGNGLKWISNSFHLLWQLLSVMHRSSIASILLSLPNGNIKILYFSMQNFSSRVFAYTETTYSTSHWNAIFEIESCCAYTMVFYSSCSLSDGIKSIKPRTEAGRG